MKRHVNVVKMDEIPQNGLKINQRKFETANARAFSCLYLTDHMFNAERYVGMYAHQLQDRKIIQNVQKHFRSIVILLILFYTCWLITTARSH